MIERFVDYLQASLLLSESAIIMKGFAPIPPVRFYRRGYAHPMGFGIYFGNPNSKLALVIASGKTMQSLRNDQYTDAEILDWVLSQDGKVSRLDLAVTEWIDTEFVTMEDIKSWAKDGLIDSPLTCGGFTTVGSLQSDGEERLETFYVGSLQKRGRMGLFRAYDKGVEMGIGGSIVTRIELELKREKAQITAKKLAESNDIAGNFRSRFEVNSRDFRRLMDADAVVIHRGENKGISEQEEKEERRWIWLLKQVAPSLKDAIKLERKKGRENTRMIAFLQEAGILDDVIKLASNLADAKYQDKLRRNELVPRAAEKD